MGKLVNGVYVEVVFRVLSGWKWVRCVEFWIFFVK